MKQLLTKITALFFGISITLSSLAAPVAPQNFLPIVKQTSQNALNYLPPHANRLLLSTARQSAAARQYLQHYYSPWLGGMYRPALRAVRSDMNSSFQHFYRRPGWGADHRPNSPYWIQQIINNANLPSFPNYIADAILVHATSLRALPTTQPSYTNWTQAGEGYPFDNLQISFLPTNTPIKLLHYSQDGAWCFVVAAEASGWIKSNDMAIMDTRLQQMLLHTAQYVTPTADHKNLRLGAVYPLLNQNGKGFHIIMATRQAHNRYAALTQVYVSKRYVTLWPMPLSAQNVALLVNQFIGEPYRWGGLEGHRDCSTTTRDLMAAFALWLPRNSTVQLSRGKVYRVRGLSPQQKRHILMNKAKPWVTLVGHPGHVMLYTGSRQGEQYLFHNKWGLVTYDPARGPGRAIIGQAAMTPVSLGNGFSNIYFNLLDSITLVAVLV